jgi:hypothetical protein
MPCKSMTYKAIKVPRTGIEPAHPCGHQILSLTRLPIPPSGLVGCKYKRINKPVKIVEIFFLAVICNNSFWEGKCYE